MLEVIPNKTPIPGHPARKILKAWKTKYFTAYYFNTRFTDKEDLDEIIATQPDMPEGVKDALYDLFTERIIFCMPNGFTASFIRGKLTYGGPQFWELGILDPEGKFYQITPNQNDDIIGYIPKEKIPYYLWKVATIKPS